MLSEQVLGEGFTINSCGDAHRGEGGKAQCCRGMQLEPEGFETSP